MTLIELVVVVAILGIMAGVVGLSFTRSVSAPPPGTVAAALDTIAAVRRMAIARGIPIAMAVTIEGSFEGEGPLQVFHATAFPDGSVIADAALGIDRLSGRPITSDSRRGRE
jgi:prepilin-type N-terminal cleavage/methylation domain-containing protein